MKVIFLSNTPILLLGYNRPDKFQSLIDSIKPSKPQKLVLVIDGPRANKAGDAEKVQQVRDLANRINWTNDVELVFRPENVGLRASVENAVSQVAEKYGKVIVVEDDVKVGADWINYAEFMLEKHKENLKIEHISGYNAIPSNILSPNRGSRLSRYPESYAWATWNRAWKHYDGSLEWAMNASVRDIQKIVGSKIGALRWKQNFHDAYANRISTWAYRWLASMWSRNSFMISPNRNLVSYHGHEGGTHTFMKPGWSELPISSISLDILENETLEFDINADKWAGRHIYTETLYGVTRGVAVSAALEIRKIKRLLST